jgi:hypothetical protein
MTPVLLLVREICLDFPAYATAMPEGRRTYRKDQTDHGFLALELLKGNKKSQHNPEEIQ